MSDSPMYEFGDIVWDEFFQSDDHIVPHSTSKEASEHSSLGDSRKQHHHELIGLSGNAREQSANKNVCQEKGKENISVQDSSRKIMLEKDSWSYTPNGVFPASSDSISVKEVSVSASDGTRTSSHCFKSNKTDLIGNEFCTTDPILVDKSAAVDSNSNDYPLDPMPQIDNDISFFDNDRNDKDSSDFLYYGWPDIENFEDVDRIFRNCDSTFGLGDDNGDEMGWFSSSDAIEGSGDVLKPEFRFSCPAPATMAKNSENDELMKTNETSCSINDSSLQSASISCKNNTWLSNRGQPDTAGHLYLVNGTSGSDSKDDFMPRKQPNMHKKQQKHHNRSVAKRKDPYGGSFCYADTIRTEDKKLPSEIMSQQTLPSGGIQQQKQALGPESFSHIQNKITYMQSDYGHPSDHTSNVPTLSAVKFDNDGFANISPKESSYSSNQVLSAESSRGPAFQVTSAVPSEKREKLHHQQATQTSFNTKAKTLEMEVQVPLCDPVSVEKKVLHSGRKFENHAGVVVPGEFGSSTIQDNSFASSGLDDISLEAASFRQLQLVMEQLDLRTKLCIRDSLYRLARSAEQRHNHTNLKGSYSRDDRDASGVLVAEGTNKQPLNSGDTQLPRVEIPAGDITISIRDSIRVILDLKSAYLRISLIILNRRCTGFMDSETDTNPIDRSIAHLLFHRPSDSSVIPTHDAVSFKSPTPIHGSVSSPRLMPGKSVNDDETMATETEGNMA